METNPEDVPDVGTIFYIAVAKEEPVDKPLEECRTVGVLLTLFPKENREIRKKKGLPAARRYTIARICQEALEQGALLTPEDLSMLLTKSIQTIKGDIAHLEKEGVTVPLRGSFK
jgi:hypothetical protein